MKINKIFLFITLLSFLFFSCKSTQTEAETSELEPSQLESPQTEIVTEELDKKEEITEDNESIIEIQEYEIPKEFNEPEVFDLEIIEIPATENSEEIKSIETTEEAEDKNLQLIEEETLPTIEPEKEDNIEIIDEVEDIEYVGENDQIVENLEISNIDENNLEQLNQNIETEQDTSNTTENNSLDEEDASLKNDSTTIAEIPEEEKVILPSRSVTLKCGESLEIVYPGSGWIYMGSLAEYNNLKSRGRKLGQADTKYTLLSVEPGTQIHHFYKVDNLTGEYIDDYIEVEVLDKKGSSKNIIKAPEYAQIVPKKPEIPAKSSLSKEEKSINQNQLNIDKSIVNKNKNETQLISDNENTIETISSENEYSSSEEEVFDVTNVDNSDNEIIFIDPEELFNSATAAFNEKNYPQVLNDITEYMNQTTEKKDEALFLLGQALESDSSIKNIKNAIKSYQELVDNFPTSKYWEKANKRIIYLKRFYLEVR